MGDADNWLYNIENLKTPARTDLLKIMPFAAHRKRLTLLVVILAAILGAASGFLIWRTVTLKMAMVELDHHALRYMLRAEDSSSASERFLKTMAAAHLAPCSDAEIVFMHHLLIQSEYLRDGGRMMGGRVECDTMLRPSELPTTVYKPDFRLKDGTEVYTDIRLVSEDPEARVGVERGGFFVTYLHWRPDRLGNLPLDFTLTEVGNTGGPPGWLHGEKPGAPLAILAKEGWANVGGTLYATHCSPHYFNCFTAFVSINKALGAQGRQSFESAAAGGVAGVLCGFLLMALYYRNQSMVYQLRRAIRSQKLRVVYQPIVHLESRRIVQAEALVRWSDDTGYEVAPAMFVQVAEANGFVGELTELVVRTVLRDLGEVLRARPDFSINVNVTGKDLADHTFLPTLERLLADAKVAAKSLTIEITESCTAKNEVAVETIKRLRYSGHRVQIDDFGTGYSSLSYLHSLAVDAIKIDKSFTHAIGTEAVTVSILPQILAIAKTLNLQVVAEGIETDQQAAYFARCEQPILGQGWLYGYPVAADLFCRLLNSNERKSSP
ncbi:MAG TPA: EAL domain-containing protein [Steroidobacteraceae bacterium]|nr:EAL domain-containing protein [Steroidobacteraceae bacterium]